MYDETSDEKRIVDLYFDEYEAGVATRDDALDCIGAIAAIVTRRANPGKFRTSPLTVNEDGAVVLAWRIVDDGDTWATGAVAGGDAHDIAWRLALSMGVYTVSDFW